MVDLKTAIEELNTGMICFSSPTPIGEDDSPDFCTTEGEVVIHLRRLLEYETPGSLYPDNNHKVPSCPYCHSENYLFNRNGERNKRCGRCGKLLDWGKNK